MPSSVEHTRSWPKPKSGSQLWETVTKIWDQFPWKILKASPWKRPWCVPPYLTAVGKWIWITNTTFPSSSWELFVVGDLLLGPRAWDPVLVWEGHWVGEWIPLLWDATRELCRRTINFKSVWFLPTAGKNPQGAFLHLLRTPVKHTCPWGLYCEAEPSWESWNQLWAVHGAGGRGLIGTGGGGSRPSATCQMATGNF